MAYLPSETDPHVSSFSIQKCSVVLKFDEDAGVIRVFCSKTEKGKTGDERWRR